MRARDIVGRRIVRVEQQRYDTRCGEVQWQILWLELDNGTRVVLHPEETEYEPIVTATVVKRAKFKARS